MVPKSYIENALEFIYHNLNFLTISKYLNPIIITQKEVRKIILISPSILPWAHNQKRNSPRFLPCRRPNNNWRPMKSNYCNKDWSLRRRIWSFRKNGWNRRRNSLMGKTLRNLRNWNNSRNCTSKWLRTILTWAKSNLMRRNLSENVFSEIKPMLNQFKA